MPFKTPPGSEIPQPDKDALTAEEQELLTRVAKKIVDRRMTVPAIMFLESIKPLNWFGSQAMIFLEPFVSAVVGEKTFIFFTIKDYNLLRQMMERRENTERLLQKIEELDAVEAGKESEEKRRRKAQKKTGSFWRRLLGREKPEDTVPPK
jgi:hypothetical protein